MPNFPHRRFILSLLSFLTAALMAIMLFGGVLAQETRVNASFARASNEAIPVNVLTSQSCLLNFDQPISRMSVSNSEIAEAILVSPEELVINGKTPGRLRLTVWGKAPRSCVFVDVDVRLNLSQIEAQIRALFPKADIQLSQANGSVVLSGNVANPRIAEQAEKVIQAAGFKTVNLLVQPILNAAQVQLQFRIAEVNRNKLREFSFTPAVQTAPGEGGYANSGLGPWTLDKVEKGSIFGSVAPSALNLFVMSSGAFTFLRALQSNGLLRALAEPNLIAMNGKQASFLAGGEFPVPIVQGTAVGGGGVTVVYKEYGVRLNFTPTILDENHIRLDIEPEVSTLDYSNVVRLNGFLIPALRTRRAKTGIELQDGQSFGIAGLLDNNEVKSLSRVPVISDVPILGQLFKSRSFQRQETELLFIVTAKITQPLNPDSVPRIRELEDLKGASPLGLDYNEKDTTKAAPPATDSPSANKKKQGLLSEAEPAEPASKPEPPRLASPASPAPTAQAAKTESAPASISPAPAKVETAPANVQPAPAKIEAAPAKTQPAPAKIEAAPASQPAPAKIEAAPAKTQPAPAKIEAAPATQPAPAKIEAAPATQPAPAKIEAAPAKTQPAPTTQPAPAKIEAVPATLPAPAKIEAAPATQPIVAKTEAAPAKTQPAPAKIEAAPATQPAPAKIEAAPVKSQPEPANKMAPASKDTPRTGSSSISSAQLQSLKSLVWKPRLPALSRRGITILVQ